MKVPICWILVAGFELCAAGRILYLAPIPSKSHFILSERLVEELAERGHEVIVVAPFKRSKPMRNVNEIIIPDVSEGLIGTLDPNVTDGSFQLRQKIPSLYFTSDGAEALMEQTMTHQPVADLLVSEQKIDLVVGISASAEGLLAGFAHRFQAPMVVISTFLPHTSINEMVVNPAPSSYVPDGGLPYTDSMSFYQRLINFLHSTTSQIAFYGFHLPRQDRLMKKYFGEDLPPLKELLLNNSLVLVNHHFGLGFPRPYLPNVIEIGGFHVRPSKPLPKDLERYMNEAEDGVIYVNLGSNLKSEEFPTEKFENIAKAFSNFSQRVLWKFDRENPNDLPKNVKISKWLPQSDILAHPNLKLFVTHGGLLGLSESIIRGVPIVGIPAFPDQATNVKLVENLQVGVELPFQAINQETLSGAIQQVLNDSTYSTNAKSRSKILQDRPLPPLDTAVYWLEYVIRHEGAPHLRSGARHLAWYQLYLIDVLLLIGVVLSVGIYLTHKLCFWVFRMLRDSGIEDIPLLKKND